MFSCLEWLRQGQRGLAEDVAPAVGSAHVGIAEPESTVERTILGGAFFPKLGGDHGGVAPNADLLGEFVVAFVSGSFIASFVEEVVFGIRLPGTGDEDEVVGKDLAHGGGVIHFDGSLIFGVQDCDGFGVVFWGVSGGPGDACDSNAEESDGGESSGHAFRGHVFQFCLLDS